MQYIKNRRDVCKGACLTIDANFKALENADIDTTAASFVFPRFRKHAFVAFEHGRVRYLRSSYTSRFVDHNLDDTHIAACNATLRRLPY